LKTQAQLGSVSVGDGHPVRIMAAINVSPESFYKGSVAVTDQDVSVRIRKAVEDGADLIDIGAMSTAPYFKGEVSGEVEASRVLAALGAISESEKVHAAISVDTVRASVARAALDNGATVINDVSGLLNDADMAGVINDRGASLLAMAHSLDASRERPMTRVRNALRDTLKMAKRAGIDERCIVVDPGIGFFREDGVGRAYSPQKIMPWYEWDCQVLARLRELRPLGRPVCVGLSRKSFLGKVLGLESPEERLPASLAAAAVAVLNGASLIRTHDVKETVQAVRTVEAIMKKQDRVEGQVV
jgi:dihydropteroate synthase